VKRVLLNTNEIKFEKDVIWDKIQKRNVKTLCSIIQILIIKLIDQYCPVIENNQKHLSADLKIFPIDELAGVVMGQDEKVKKEDDKETTLIDGLYSYEQVAYVFEDNKEWA